MQHGEDRARQQEQGGRGGREPPGLEAQAEGVQTMGSSLLRPEGDRAL